MARRRPGRRQSWETETATRSKMILTLNQMELHRREGKRKTGCSIPFSPGSFGLWEPEASLSRVGGGALSGGFWVNLWAGGILEERLFSLACICLLTLLSLAALPSPGQLEVCVLLRVQADHLHTTWTS